MSKEMFRSPGSNLESRRVPIDTSIIKNLTRTLTTTALAVLILGAATSAHADANKAVSFTDISAGLIGVRLSDANWGDYDNDGDLDVALIGSTIHPNYYARIYRNDAGVFTDIAAGLPGVAFGSIRWGDYDNDGDLDLLLTGVNSVPANVSSVYRNDAGTFTDIGAGLPGLKGVRGDWGDYDNDGDLDLLHGGDGAVTDVGGHIFRNDAGTFTDVSLGFPNPLGGLRTGTMEWGDFDTDGDLDILIAGNFGSTTYATIVVRNDAGVFTDHLAGLPGGSSATWGDYDNDGDLDILRTGYDDSGFTGTTRVHRNDAGVFVETATNLWPVHGKATWGDYDNDGDLDIAMTGIFSSSNITKLYSNNAGTFTEFAAGLEQLSGGSVAWGDYDGDADLDLLISGSLTTPGWTTRIYRNDSTIANTRPFPPVKISAIRVGGTVTFTWLAPGDLQTPQAGLQYNLRVGSTPGGHDIVSPMSASPDGYRRVVRRGNCGHATSRAIAIAPGTNFYWGVQSIDTAFEGSLFGFEDTDFELFTDVGASLTGISGGAVDWGDYDNDGDLDFVAAGSAGSGKVSMIYRNDAGSFTDIGAGLLGAGSSAADWGDYDNDGDLDLYLTGSWDGGGSTPKIYRNDGGVFTDIVPGLNAVFGGSGDWGDYDNDGDLDLLATGLETSTWACRVYRNDSGLFSDISAGLIGLLNSEAAWGDYDADGDLDIVVCGADLSDPVTKIYRNDSGLFTDIGATVANVKLGGVDWGDVDGDGDLDLLLAGRSTPFVATRVYMNNAGSFSELVASLRGLESCAVQWGDYDGDGDLDFLATGIDGNGDDSTRIYRNQDGIFEVITSGLPAVGSSAAAWGDYDNDGDLDLLLAGFISDVASLAIYRNNTSTANTAPTPPTNLQAVLIGSNVIRFSWDAATDAESAALGLSYNLRVGTTPGGSELYASMANLASGWRRLAQRGDIEPTVVDFAYTGVGPIYWGIQAVDQGFAGSAFASAVGSVTGVEDRPSTHRFFLGQAFPNPFNPSTSISFVLPRRGHCELVVYDMGGRRVCTLIDGARDAGEHTIGWEGMDARGKRVASGNYVYGLRFAGREEFRRMTLLK